MCRLFLVDLCASSSLLLFPALELSAVCPGDDPSERCGPARLEDDGGRGFSPAAAEAEAEAEAEAAELPEAGALRDDFSLLRAILGDVLRGESGVAASMAPEAAATRLAARALRMLSRPSSAQRLIFSCSSLSSLTKPSKNLTRLSKDM
ncbi:hypothetical protein TASIC1_0014012700 [Trichoderma asperellum]|uniref:Uncharacterized protein n=1 Tax=Trichoderma asperellum TaxID=101201 RepID=A0A6V8R6G3_TRIAP|nr:hypothetical protein TASIC1_0014012700 [Trichoderma asperellum]